MPHPLDPDPIPWIQIQISWIQTHTDPDPTDPDPTTWIQIQTLPPASTFGCMLLDHLIQRLLLAGLLQIQHHQARLAQALLLLLLQESHLGRSGYDRNHTGAHHGADLG